MYGNLTLHELLLSEFLNIFIILLGFIIPSAFQCFYLSVALCAFYDKHLSIPIAHIVSLFLLVRPNLI